jgi:hypothetical protein
VDRVEEDLEAELAVELEQLTHIEPNHNHDQAKRLGNVNVVGNQPQIRSF